MATRIAVATLPEVTEMRQPLFNALMPIGGDAVAREVDRREPWAGVPDEVPRGSTFDEPSIPEGSPHVGPVPTGGGGPSLFLNEQDSMALEECTEDVMVHDG